MLNELEILEKHLGVANKDMDALKQQTQKFVEDISDANDFIAILQLVNKALKKMKASLIEKDKEELKDKVLIASELMSIADECSFMNLALFDNSYLVKVGDKSFSFELKNPLFILESGSYDDMLAYINDRFTQSTMLLGEIGLAIMSFDTQDSFGTASLRHDFSPSGLKNIFRQ